MYSQFFNLKENPFSETPDTKFFFASPSHQDVLEQMLWLINTGKSFGLLSGEVGIGKTLLSRYVFRHLPASVNTALILCPQLNGHELIETICDELKLVRPPAPAGGHTFKSTLDTLHAHLIMSANAGKRTLLIVDESQLLSPNALETIRLLSNLETESRKLIQIVLVAQPELSERLGNREYRQIAQRISVHMEIKPFDPATTERYIRHRLEVAGDSNLVRFDVKTVKFIHGQTGGIPRLINRYCEVLVLAASQSKVRLIDLKFAKRVLEGEVRALNTVRLVYKPEDSRP